MIEFSKRTVVLSSIKLRLKALHNIKSFLCIFESVLIRISSKSQEENSGNFLKLDLWQPCSRLILLKRVQELPCLKK